MTERRNMTVFGVVLCVLFIGSQGLGERVVLAGNLEPPGPPSPTMKTLDQTTGAWDQVLPAAERFVPVMGGAAVLDKETNLVWEQSPETTPQLWLGAREQCSLRTVGGRKGWRLASVHELASLLDPTNNGNPKLPVGHPFSNVQSDFYWSATTFADSPNVAWNVLFLDGIVFTGDKTGNFYFVWCVRGGGPFSEY